MTWIDVTIVFLSHNLDMESRFGLRWRSILVGQEFGVKTKLFEVAVGVADKIEEEEEVV